MEIATSRLWGLRFTLPAIAGDTGDRRYVRNWSVTCICDTLTEAVSMVTTKWPDATLWSVQHRGQEDTYFQKGHVVLVDDKAVAGERQRTE